MMAKHQVKQKGYCVLRVECTNHFKEADYRELEEKVRHLDGVSKASINLLTNKITIEYDPSMHSLEEIREKLRAETKALESS